MKLVFVFALIFYSANLKAPTPPETYHLPKTQDIRNPVDPNLQRWFKDNIETTAIIDLPRKRFLEKIEELSEAERLLLKLRFHGKRNKKLNEESKNT